jgi:hypothetical protein
MRYTTPFPTHGINSFFNLRVIAVICFDLVLSSLLVFNISLHHITTSPINRQVGCEYKFCRQTVGQKRLLSTDPVCWGKSTQENHFPTDCLSAMEYLSRPTFCLACHGPFPTNCLLGLPWAFPERPSDMYYCLTNNPLVSIWAFPNHYRTWYSFPTNILLALALAFVGGTYERCTGFTMNLYYASSLVYLYKWFGTPIVVM